MFKVADMVMQQTERVTHPVFKLITGEHFFFSVLAGLIVEKLFMLFSIYNAVQWVKNE